ncbi:exonuclease VII small subunit [Desulfamplus magnetovallimortis]|uniref:Exodeoxyribonuclease 7 small subunit n=1 Tax=Desulfamplus magnetovallimortis TaxID=1246637 RepID=L0R4Z6_9BACT|nr:exodeoxyribonuclease VII small subunit [Desulfamplus magnetovallimortis]CCO06627.1 exonuclease VII small subunit [Desulfamplus magnetovallimortis BW-1]SLM32678.1 exonuclease VII small subunit [Desulfamplus magnetovallimortis]
MAKKKTFESSLEELELIVKELESGNLPLEDAIKKFESGMKCSRFCLEKLDEIENKITILINDGNGNLQEKPFDNE